MTDEQGTGIESLIAHVVVPVAGLLLTYWIGTHAATIEIEVRSRIAHARRTLKGQTAAPRVAEWYVKSEAPKVIAHAEDITREAAE